ncbi:hypothetical protein K505DRAFT_338652 [Melanomma pulvis-pyrius CBS 109.77]|uniref:Uncharacterized protein n=1 Tax=Melanomma pulvis-pyrius CBS 109.77 TaxID=1314802 RepID=A0A6A6X8J2_9PLEO|nr:hypothetical protein K505DRAFT_338652 [Melanomma pulvis-pyrius CBS 109.77]
MGPTRPFYEFESVSTKRTFAPQRVSSICRAWILGVEPNHLDTEDVIFQSPKVDPSDGVHSVFAPPPILPGEHRDTEEGQKQYECRFHGPVKNHPIMPLINSSPHPIKDLQLGSFREPLCTQVFIQPPIGTLSVLSPRGNNVHSASMTSSSGASTCAKSSSGARISTEASSVASEPEYSLFNLAHPAALRWLDRTTEKERSGMTPPYSPILPTKLTPHSHSKYLRLTDSTLLQRFSPACRLRGGGDGNEGCQISLPSTPRRRHVRHPSSIQATPPSLYCQKGRILVNSTSPNYVANDFAEIFNLFENIDVHDLSQERSAQPAVEALPPMATDIKRTYLSCTTGSRNLMMNRHRPNPMKLSNRDVKYSMSKLCSSECDLRARLLKEDHQSEEIRREKSEWIQNHSKQQSGRVLVSKALKPGLQNQSLRRSRDAEKSLTVENLSSHTTAWADTDARIRQNAGSPTPCHRSEKLHHSPCAILSGHAHGTETRLSRSPQFRQNFSVQRSPYKNSTQPVAGHNEKSARFHQSYSMENTNRLFYSHGNSMGRVGIFECSICRCIQIRGVCLDRDGEMQPLSDHPPKASISRLSMREPRLKLGTVSIPESQSGFPESQGCIDDELTPSAIDLFRTSPYALRNSPLDEVRVQESPPLPSLRGGCGCLSAESEELHDYSPEQLPGDSEQPSSNDPGSQVILMDHQERLFNRGYSEADAIGLNEFNKYQPRESVCSGSLDLKEPRDKRLILNNSSSQTTIVSPTSLTVLRVGQNDVIAWLEHVPLHHTACYPKGYSERLSISWADLIDIPLQEDTNQQYHSFPMPRLRGGQGDEEQDDEETPRPPQGKGKGKGKGKERRVSPSAENHNPPGSQDRESFISQNTGSSSAHAKASHASSSKAQAFGSSSSRGSSSCRQAPDSSRSQSGASNSQNTSSGTSYGVQSQFPESLQSDDEMEPEATRMVTGAEILPLNHPERSEVNDIPALESAWREMVQRFRALGVVVLPPINPSEPAQPGPTPSPSLRNRIRNRLNGIKDSKTWRPWMRGGDGEDYDSDEDCDEEDDSLEKYEAEIEEERSSFKASTPKSYLFDSYLTSSFFETLIISPVQICSSPTIESVSDLQALQDSKRLREQQEEVSETGPPSINDETRRQVEESQQEQASESRPPSTNDEPRTQVEESQQCPSHSPQPSRSQSSQVLASQAHDSRDRDQSSISATLLGSDSSGIVAFPEFDWTVTADPNDSYSNFQAVDGQAQEAAEASPPDAVRTQGASRRAKVKTRASNWWEWIKTTAKNAKQRLRRGRKKIEDEEEARPLTSLAESEVDEQDYQDDRPPLSCNPGSGSQPRGNGNDDGGGDGGAAVGIRHRPNHPFLAEFSL